MIDTYRFKALQNEAKRSSEAKIGIAPAAVSLAHQTSLEDLVLVLGPGLSRFDPSWR